MRRTIGGALIAGLAVVHLAGCGGGSGSGSGGGGVSISSISGPRHMQAGVSPQGGYVFSATVSGSSDRSITWSVSDSSLATIDASIGVATPSQTNTGVVTIIATANADSTKQSTLQVNVVDWILAGQVEEMYGLPIGLQVEVINSDGTNPATLIPSSVLPESGYTNCVWAYDHVKFVCSPMFFPGSAPTQLAIFETDGTEGGTKQTATIDMAQLGFTGIFGNEHFSPDGSKLVFEGGTTGAGGALSAGTYLVAADGKSAPALLAPDASGYDAVAGNPRFTPDGTEILYSQEGSVWIMNADGSNQRQLLAGESENAEFTPDMKTLFYSSSTGIYRANADGSNAVNIAGPSYTFEGLSPSGKSILLVTWAPLGTNNVYTADTDGGNLKLLNGSEWASW